MFMKTKTLNSATVTTQTFPPAAYTASADGTEVVLYGSQSWTFQVNVGAWTSGSVVIHFERRTKDLTDWEAIPPIDLYGLDLEEVQRLDGDTLTYTNTYSITDATKDGRVDLVQYIGFPRPLRARIVGTSTPSATLSVNVIEFNLRFEGRNAMRENWPKSNER